MPPQWGARPILRNQRLREGVFRDCYAVCHASAQRNQERRHRCGVLQLSRFEVIACTEARDTPLCRVFVILSVVHRHFPERRQQPAFFFNAEEVQRVRESGRPWR
jgi:hypothetical protein